MIRSTRLGILVGATSLLALTALPIASAHSSVPASPVAEAGHQDITHGTTAAQQKRAVLRLLDAYRTGDRSAFAVINPEKFIQHDPALGDGLAGLKSWLASAPRGAISVDPVRVLVDGPYVLVHSNTKLPTGRTVAWDVFRFEQGRIVEHWGTHQPAAGPNGAGHTEIDGPTRVVDNQRTDANKRLVWQGMTEVFMQGDFSRYGEPIWKADTYIQHSLGVASDGVAGSKPFYESLVKTGKLRVDKINKVFGEGNFTLVIGQGSYEGTPYSYYDLFRLSRGKIVEHWDVMNPLTPADQAKNANGQFNFPQDPLTDHR
ncbi:nuclear transport factor 2 family protein [Streptomyces sp. NPDC091281]|uniref:nuclear transport factor 2 family protein n=1 Tax=Streptomyces sp. NPDC091281 TaxID=3365985 RepID=UPI0037FE6F59